MFLEHDDLYHAGGHTHIQIGPKLIDPPANAAATTKSSKASPPAWAPTTAASTSPPWK